MTGKLMLIPAGFFLVVAILLLLAGAAGAMQAVAVNPHIAERHGAAGLAVAASFLDDGRCNLGPSMVMRSQSRGSDMFICFETPERVHLYYRTTAEKRAITSIPAEHMRNPLTYIRNVIARDGYVAQAEYGELPGWFMRLLAGQ